MNLHIYIYFDNNDMYPLPEAVEAVQMLAFPRVPELFPGRPSFTRVSSERINAKDIRSRFSHPGGLLHPSSRVIRRLVIHAVTMFFLYFIKLHSDQPL